MYRTPCAVSIDLARHERMIDERDRREAALEEAREWFLLEPAVYFAAEDEERAA